MTNTNPTRPAYEHDRQNPRNSSWMWLLGLVAAALVVIALFFLLGGDADLDSEGGDVDVPAVDADVDAPDVDAEAPDVDVEGGDIDVEEGDAEADADGSDGG